MAYHTKLQVRERVSHLPSAASRCSGMGHQEGGKDEEGPSQKDPP